MSSKITKAIQNARQQGGGALIGYIMAGDPTPEATPKIAGALIRGGVDVLELGLPFSDPIADGPTIQAAGVRALAAGTTPQKTLEIAEKIKQSHDIPIVVMTYFNPVFRIGLEKFCSQASKHGVDGLIVPDLPVEEAAEYRKTAQAHGLDTIFLAAPSTSNLRLAEIVAASSGFLYVVSHYGVTGAKKAMADSTVQLIKRVAPFTADKIPLAVGFGISQPQHVQRVIGAGADAAIVGSAFIKIIDENQKNTVNMLKLLEAQAQELKSACKTRKTT
jgi:tryptophan synthase alpha chain